MRSLFLFVNKVIGETNDTQYLLERNNFCCFKQRFIYKNCGNLFENKKEYDNPLLMIQYISDSSLNVEIVFVLHDLILTLRLI